MVKKTMTDGQIDTGKHNIPNAFLTKHGDNESILQPEQLFKR